MAQDAVISIGAGASQLPLIKTAKQMGYRVVAVDRNASAPGFEWSDEKCIMSTHDTVNVVAELGLLQERYRYKGVVARTVGKALFTASAVAEKFRLPGIEKNVLPLVTEKSALREFCHKNNIVAPQGVRIKKDGHTPVLLRFPLVVKPDFTVIGKKNISIVRDKAYLLSAITAACAVSGNQYAEVETYVDGADVSSLFFVEEGKATFLYSWDELIGIDEKGGIEGLGISVPSMTAQSGVEEKIKNIMGNIVSHFPKMTAFLILSCRVGKKGESYVIELHADLGGEQVMDRLIPKATRGINYFAEIIRALTRSGHPVKNLVCAPSLLFLPSGEIIQQESVEKNFDRFAALIRARGGKIRQIPHYMLFS
ncbi:MAG: hypothetical protein Q8O83_04200 [bacterium]|nr:hypothetical protein [bacterium]